VRLDHPDDHPVELNEFLAPQFGGERFVTGQVLRVDIPGGTGAIINAGHPLPLRVRGGRVEPVGLDADLPLGLDGAPVYTCNSSHWSQGTG
jgi:serine phosphatase RsbU (regulator of sigma subunit)